MERRFTVDDLIGLAPPPVRRIDAGSPGQWGEVEHALGIALPEDYKLIINAYGTGGFNDLFYLFNPFSGVEGMNLLNQARWREARLEGSHLESYEGAKAVFPDLCPFATFPDPGGLLPAGGDTNGGRAFWLTGGQPDEWPLVFYPHGFHPVERHDTPLVDFLVLWLSGELPDCFGGAGKHFVNRTDRVFENH